MSDQTDKANNFTALHVAGDPVIIYNAWDGGSAKAILKAGAKAIATGDHPVGYAHGFGDDDFSDFSFDTYLVTIKEIAKRITDVPFSVDISNGEGLDEAGLQQRIHDLLDIGIVGINFEDRLDDDSGIKSVAEQSGRLRAIRAAADDHGVPLFINARSDIFATSDNHSAVLEEAISRSQAYQEAGANGFFVPGLMDIELIQQLCERAALPVNIIRLPGAPSTAELKAAGVSRISYGPVVQMQTMEWLEGQAKQALAGSF